MHYPSPEINRVVAYIEAHLDDGLDVETLAGVAGYSPFHFSRLFKAATGESLGGMIKRLRLERGAKQLYNASQSITEIGMESGYRTPSSFTKAFKQRFDYAPNDFRAQLRREFEVFYSRLRQPPSLVVRKAQRLLCCRATGDYMTSAIDAWQCLYKAAVPIAEDATYFGLCYDIPGITEQDKIRYEAAVSVDAESRTRHDRLFFRTLPGGTYATLTYQGDHDDLYEIWPQFYGWIQAQQLTLADFAPIEHYHDDPAQMLQQMPEKPVTELMLLLRR